MRCLVGWVVCLVALWVSALVNAVVGFVFGSSVFFVLRNRIASWISARVADEIESLVRDWVDELKANPQALESFVRPLVQSWLRGVRVGVFSWTCPQFGSQFWVRFRFL